MLFNFVSSVLPKDIPHNMTNPNDCKPPEQWGCQEKEACACINFVDTPYIFKAEMFVNTVSYLTIFGTVFVLVYKQYYLPHRQGGEEAWSSLPMVFFISALGTSAAMYFLICPELYTYIKSSENTAYACANIPNEGAHQTCLNDYTFQSTAAQSIPISLFILFASTLLTEPAVVSVRRLFNCSEQSLRNFFVNQREPELRGTEIGMIGDPDEADNLDNANLERLDF